MVYGIYSRIFSQSVELDHLKHLEYEINKNLLTV